MPRAAAPFPLFICSNKQSINFLLLLPPSIHRQKKVMAEVTEKVMAEVAEVNQENQQQPEKPSAPHKLERKWTFWYDKPKQQGAAWGASLKKAYTFDTVEEFWCLYDQIFRPSKLPANADFHCFKSGIEPKWEDPECANGGKWSITSSRKASLDTMWLETLMALFGEQFDESEEICGVVASVRPRADKLALWTKTASNEAVQMSIGKKWKEIVDVTDKIMYNFHDDSRSKAGSRSVRYNV